MAVLLHGGGIFLHIPKTGGNWVTHSLEELGLIQLKFGHKHLDLERTMHFEHYLLDANKWAQPSYRLFRFCFVRHPVTWYESWWRMMQKLDWPKWGTDGNIDDWHPNAPLNELGHPKFNNFMENVLKKRPGYVSELYSRYTGSGIDFIGKQENLRNDLSTVLNRFGFPENKDFLCNNPALNVSDISYTLDWDPDILLEVKRTEYASLKRFGYA